MASMTSVTCHNNQCKKVFQTRTADVKRGWGKFCCKSCKAQEQEDRTGQYKSYCCNQVNKFINKQSKTRDLNDSHTFYASFSNEDDTDMHDEDDGDFDWAYDDDNGVWPR